MSDPDLDQAVEQFHAALDASDDVYHSRDGDAVEGFASFTVEALLAAGWRPPEVPE